MNDPKSILVVDDQRLPRTILSTNLKESGYTVWEADSGKKALELLRGQAIDLVLLDLFMPDMDGFEVLEQIKSDSLIRNIPVVIVSGNEDMESIRRCIKMGAADHVFKPFDPVLLHARLRAIFDIS
ncbi:response regulator [bacterium]|nr:response regulator [bacterium]